jgi:hypothetical protein
MVKYTLDQYVDAPRERVFATATDLRRAPEFMSGIQALEVLTEGPIRKGTRFRETRMMFKRPATVEMEITSFDPPRSYDVGCEDHGCVYATRFRFEPKGSGTNVVLEWEAVPQTLVARVMGVIFAPMIKSCMKLLRKDLQDLGHAAEAKARPAS